MAITQVGSPKKQSRVFFAPAGCRKGSQADLKHERDSRPRGFSRAETEGRCTPARN